MADIKPGDRFEVLAACPSADENGGALGIKVGQIVTAAVPMEYDSRAWIIDGQNATFLLGRPDWYRPLPPGAPEAPKAAAVCEWHKCKAAAVTQRTDIGGTMFDMCAAHAAEGDRRGYHRPAPPPPPAPALVMPIVRASHETVAARYPAPAQYRCIRSPASPWCRAERPCWVCREGGHELSRLGFNDQHGAVIQYSREQRGISADLPPARTYARPELAIERNGMGGIWRVR